MHVRDDFFAARVSLRGAAKIFQNAGRNGAPIGDGKKREDLVLSAFLCEALYAGRVGAVLRDNGAGAPNPRAETAT